MDSSTLRDLADHLRRQAASAEEHAAGEPVEGYALVVVEALDNALIMIGRSGTEVFHRMMKQYYGFEKADIATKPGQYMSGIKALLDSSSDMIEGYILREVQRTRNITAGSVEDAVNQLKQAERFSSSGNNKP